MALDHLADCGLIKRLGRWKDHVQVERVLGRSRKEIRSGPSSRLELGRHSCHYQKD